MGRASWRAKWVLGGFVLSIGCGGGAGADVGSTRPSGGTTPSTGGAAASLGGAPGVMSASGGAVGVSAGAGLGMGTGVGGLGGGAKGGAAGGGNGGGGSATGGQPACVSTPSVLPVTGARVLSDTLVEAQSVTSSKGAAYLVLTGLHGDVSDDDFLVAACPVDFSEVVSGTVGAGKYVLVTTFTPDGTCSWRKRIYGPPSEPDNFAVAALDDGVAIAGSIATEGSSNEVVALRADGSIEWQLPFPKLGISLATAPDGLFIGGAYLKNGNVGGFVLPTDENGIYIARVTGGAVTWLKKIPATVTGPGTAVHSPIVAARTDGSIVFMATTHNVAYPDLTIDDPALIFAAEIDPSGVTKWVTQLGHVNPGSSAIISVLGDDGTTYFVGAANGVLDGVWVGEGAHVVRCSPVGKCSGTTYSHANFRSAAFVDSALFVGGDFTSSIALAGTSVDPKGKVDGLLRRMGDCGPGSAAVLGGAAIRAQVTSATRHGKGVLISGIAAGAVVTKAPLTCAAATLDVGSTVLPPNGCFTTFVAMVAQ